MAGDHYISLHCIGREGIGFAEKEMPVQIMSSGVQCLALQRA